MVKNFVYIKLCRSWSCNVLFEVKIVNQETQGEPHVLGKLSTRIHMFCKPLLFHMDL